jgi:hypothetical protein
MITDQQDLHLKWQLTELTDVGIFILRSRFPQAQALAADYDSRLAQFEQDCAESEVGRILDESGHNSSSSSSQQQHYAGSEILSFRNAAVCQNDCAMSDISGLKKQDRILANAKTNHFPAVEQMSSGAQQLPTFASASRCSTVSLAGHCMGPSVPRSSVVSLVDFSKGPSVPSRRSFPTDPSSNRAEWTSRHLSDSVKIDSNQQVKDVVTREGGAPGY